MRKSKIIFFFSLLFILFIYFNIFSQIYKKNKKDYAAINELYIFFKSIEPDTNEWNIIKYPDLVKKYGIYKSSNGNIGFYDISPIVCDHCYSIYTLFIYNFETKEKKIYRVSDITDTTTINNIVLILKNINSLEDRNVIKLKNNIYTDIIMTIIVNMQLKKKYFDYYLKKSNK